LVPVLSQILKVAQPADMPLSVPASQCVLVHCAYTCVMRTYDPYTYPLENGTNGTLGQQAWNQPNRASQMLLLVWDITQPGTRNVSPRSAAAFILRRSLLRPADCTKATCDSVLVALSPIAREFFDAIAQNLLDGNVVAALNPIVDERLPSILIVALLLFVGGYRVHLGRIDPPDFAISISCRGLRP
jgi:hypothetical protein